MKLSNNMFDTSLNIGTAVIKLYAPWVRSLKEKRMIVKSLVSRIKNKFNVSVAETDYQDAHQTIVLGVCCVSNSLVLSNSIIESVVSFIENNTDATVENIIIDIL